MIVYCIKDCPSFRDSEYYNYFEKGEKYNSNVERFNSDMIWVVKSQIKGMRFQYIGKKQGELEYFSEYFETIHERRKRIIKKIITI